MDNQKNDLQITNQDINPENISKLLVEAVTDYAIFALDTKGFIITWNTGGERLKGYTASEIIGSHFSIFYTEEDIINGKPEMELRIAESEGRYEEEGWRLRKDRSMFWANVTITALRDKDFVLRGFAKVTRDLTSKKQAEEALRLSHTRYRLLVDGVKDYAILMLDTKGRIVSWNEGAKRIKGYEAKEILGSYFSIFYTAKDIADHKPENELIVAAELGHFEEEGIRVRKDGSTFIANIVITAIRDSSGELVGFSKVTRDVTERKKAEDNLRIAYENLERRVLDRTSELAEAKDQAEYAVKARDEFLSIASHELKTPLTSLKLQTQMRKRYLQKGKLEHFDETNLSRMLEDDEKQFNRLARLVDDMLDIAKLDTGKLTFELEKTSLSSIVSDLVNRFDSQLESAGTPVTFKCTSTAIGEWDRYRVEQIVSNLLTNAMKYGEGKPLTILVEDDGQFAKCIIKDQGIGIHKNDLERIFLQFERAVPSKSISGLGLGLYISKQIAESHGGKLSLESDIGVGSTFTLSLPLLHPNIHPPATKTVLMEYKHD